jgi:acyl-lipid omega-6 desaturase (Delta-12 desaturase)
MNKVILENFNTATAKIDTNLAGIKAVIPSKYLTSHRGWAFFYIVVALSFYTVSLGFSVYVFIYSFYYLYPVAWFLTGTAVTSLFVIGHDCAHESFYQSKRANSFWGHLMFVPSLYPFYAWKYSHAAHHKYTNLYKLSSEHVYYDNAWLPLSKQEYQILKDKSPFSAWLYRLTRSVIPIGSTLHNIVIHFFLRKFKEEHRNNVIYSYIVLSFFVILIVAALIYFTQSIFSIFHFFILPAFFFQFWMSTYTFLHHIGSGAVPYSEGEWNSFKGQVLSTVNCYFPKFISFLHFHIDCHLPHHVTIRVPSYYLQEVQQIFKESKYSGFIVERQFTFSYLYQTLKENKLWDEKERKMVPFV